MPAQNYSPWARPRTSKKIEEFANFQVLYGFRYLGPHRSLVNRLLGDVVETCLACGGAGLAGTFGGIGLRACPLCHGIGSTYTISLAELEKRRQQVIAQFPDAGIAGWRPFLPFNVPGLKLDTGEVIELAPDPRGWEQLELPLGY